MVGWGQRGFIQHRKFQQQEEVRLSKELLDDGPDPKKEGKMAGNEARREVAGPIGAQNGQLECLHRGHRSRTGW